VEGYSNQPIPKEAAKQLLALDLEDKEILTYEKLDQWYTAWNGKCYVSFSGGKDSTVLAYLAARYLSSFRAPPQMFGRQSANAPFSDIIAAKNHRPFGAAL
jgi:3'-phosphoadenosine 5'-phosphosulfate sulfotransferase (PAPS reductase)/FAD synthetase